MTIFYYLWHTICTYSQKRYLARRQVRWQEPIVSYFKKKLMTMEKFICNTCGYVYDPAVGDPDAGIAPGTPFESLPDDWVCPLCGVGKDDFEPYNE